MTTKATTKTQPETSDSTLELEVGKRIFPHTSTDFQRFVAHEDFHLYLQWAVKVQEIYLCLKAKTVPVLSEILSLCHKKEFSDDTRAMTIFIQSKLIPDNTANEIFFDTQQYCFCIHRGVFVEIDCLVDTSIALLECEFTRCMDWYTSEVAKLPLVRSNGRAAKMPRLGVPHPNPEEEEEEDEKGDSITTKYSKEQTDILTLWMMENKDDPFPKIDDISQLMEDCNLSYSQVVNWTTNVRKRSLKATVEKGKKPHHFLDFMFLALNRESRTVKQKPEIENNGATVKAGRKYVRATRPKSNLASVNAGAKGVLNTARDFPDSKASIMEKLPEVTKNQDTKVEYVENLDPLPINTPIQLQQLKQFAEHWKAHDEEDTETAAPNHPEGKFPRDLSSTLTTCSFLSSDKESEDGQSETLIDSSRLDGSFDSTSFAFPSNDLAKFDPYHPSNENGYIKYKNKMTDLREVSHDPLTRTPDDCELHLDMLTFDQGSDNVMAHLYAIFREQDEDVKDSSSSKDEMNIEEDELMNANVIIQRENIQEEMSIEDEVSATMANIEQEMDGVDMLGLSDENEMSPTILSLDDEVSVTMTNIVQEIDDVDMLGLLEDVDDLKVLNIEAWDFV